MTEFDFTSKELQLLAQVAIKAGGGVVITMAETAGLTPSERADFIFKVASVAAGLDCNQASTSAPQSKPIAVGDSVVLCWTDTPREEPATVEEIDDAWVRFKTKDKHWRNSVWHRVDEEGVTWRRV